MFRPANASGRRDWRKARRFAFHHRNAAGMRGMVVGEAALQIAGLHEIGDKGLDDIVERVLSMRPMPQEVADIELAACSRRSNELRCHLHLVERLIPNLFEAVRFGHPGANTRIYEIEEEQPARPVWRFA